uniref:Rpn family recombination-promoting nuclease/putative transposase n=1 Tax=Caldicellulosiruptor owensensis TaxID=55205 RepID=A0A7C5Z701_9FIRM
MKLTRSYDVGFKKLFSDKINVCWFITEIIPEPRLKNYTQSDIEIVATESVDTQWKARRSDMVYRLLYSSSWVYLLVEFQSRPNKQMHCRIYEYVFLVQRKYQIDKRLPVVVPVVLFNGAEKWQPVTQFADNVEYAEDFPEYAQRLNYIFIDVRDIPEDKLLNGNNVLAAALYVDQVATNPDSVAERLLKLGKNIRIPEEQREELAEWLYHAVLKSYKIPRQEINELSAKSKILGVEEMFQSTAMKIKKGLAEEKRKIRLESKIEGKIEGRMEAQLEIARNLILEGAEDSFIAKVTGLDIEKVKELRNQQQK